MNLIPFEIHSSGEGHYLQKYNGGSNRSPVWNNTPATVESTPPDNPRTTLSSPIFSFNQETVASINDSGVQEPEQPQILDYKVLQED